MWVLFDCDPTLYSFRDIDDSLALVFLIVKQLLGTMRVVAVSTVFGNTTVDVTYRTAKLIVRKAGLTNKIPVYRGARSPSDCGFAGRYISRLIMSGKIDKVLATGPLTNIYCAIRLIDPSYLEDIDLIVMGGAINTLGNVPPHFLAEFNFHKDPEAASKVLRAPWRKVILVPLDVTRRVKLNYFVIRYFHGKTKLDFVKFVMKGAMKWAFLNTFLFGGFNPHDLLAAWIMLNENKIRFREIKLLVDTKAIPGRVLAVAKGHKVLIPQIRNLLDFYRDIKTSYTMS